MPKAVRDVPPPLELLCLKALWSLEEGNVSDVRREVATVRPLAYTTIMTVLERLVRKGKVTRRKAGRAYVYTATASREALRHVAIRELLEGFFDGSREELQRFLSQPEAQPMAAAAAAAGGTSAAAGGEVIETALL
jgi:predicted transcriptional regulator